MTKSSTRVDSRSEARKNRDRTPRPKQQPPSREAKQRAAAILEVLAGQTTTVDAAQALGVSLPRYYLLEQQALEGLVAACEPRNKGPRASPEREIARLQKEVARLQRESARQQALVRAAQRTIGLAMPQPAKGKPPQKSTKRRKRKPTVRALKAVESLKAELKESEPQPAPVTTPMGC